MRFVGSTQVKGKKEPVELYELIWERENLTMVQDVAAIETRMSNTRLTATFGNTTIEMGPSRPVLHMGRGPENEFVIPDPLASRVHARIEYRRDRFLLIDQSLNGTYLQMHGMKEMALRRDETVLEKSGIISLGEIDRGAPRALPRVLGAKRQQPDRLAGPDEKRAGALTARAGARMWLKPWRHRRRGSP